MHLKEISFDVALVVPDNPFATQTLEVHQTGEPEVLLLVNHCSSCKKETKAESSIYQLVQYTSGAMTQVAYPELSPGDREALFISGMCNECYDELTREPEESPDPEWFTDSTDESDWPENFGENEI